MFTKLMLVHAILLEPVGNMIDGCQIADHCLFGSGRPCNESLADMVERGLELRSKYIVLSRENQGNQMVRASLNRSSSSRAAEASFPGGNT